MKFLFNALRFYRDHGVRVLRVMTDNGDNGVSFRSRRYTPLHKGVANAKNQAQAHQTLYAKNKRKGRTLRADSLREWAKPAQGSSRRSLLEWPAEGYAKPYNHSSERAAALLPFLHHYNHHRPHYGINGKSPISRIPGYNLSTHDI